MGVLFQSTFADKSNCPRIPFLLDNRRRCKEPLFLEGYTVENKQIMKPPDIKSNQSLFVTCAEYSRGRETLQWNAYLQALTNSAKKKYVYVCVCK